LLELHDRRPGRAEQCAFALARGLDNNVVSESQAHRELGGHLYVHHREKKMAQKQRQQNPGTHLAVFGGTGHASGFVFRPGKDDHRVKNFDVGNVGTVVEEAL
jgi:hypothetical protein